MLRFKLLAVFFILIMLNVTPACAINLKEMIDTGQGIKKDVEEMGPDFVYLGKYFSRNTVYQLIHIKKAIEKTKHLKNKVKAVKSNVNAVFGAIKAERAAAQKLEEKADNDGLLKYYEVKETQVNNNQSVAVPESLSKNAAGIQAELKEQGIEVDIANVGLSDLKNGTIVQVTKKVDKNVFVRYYTYEGKTDTGKVKVYNGQESVEYDPTVFQKAYTGLTLKIMNPIPSEDINEINHYTQVIYQTKINTLNKKIYEYQDTIPIIIFFLAVFLFIFSFAIIFAMLSFSLFLNTGRRLTDPSGLSEAGFMFSVVLCLIIVGGTGSIASGNALAIVNKSNNRCKADVLDLKANNIF